MRKKEYQKEYMGKFFIDKWFELLCYYHYQTEMYDRSLTDMRSPHDSTEAYLYNTDTHSLSNTNARKTKSLIDKIAEMEHVLKNDNKHNELSAQGWIDQYLCLYRNGELDWLKEYIEGEIL